MRHKVKWLDGGREPQCPPDPLYPEGVHLRCSAREVCQVDLPYPAPRCGVYIIECETCGLRYGVTTAGRPDDPRSVQLACWGKHDD